MANTKNKKVTVRLSGEDGNVFAIIGRVRDALKRGGQPEKAREFVTEAMACTSYDDVLCLAMCYCEVE